MGPAGLPRRDPRLAPGRGEAFTRLCGWGLVDVYRVQHPDAGRYTWWDYRAGNFHKNFGMRIDHLLVTRALARRTVWAEIDREARKGKPIPSDHAPLVIDVDGPGCALRRGLGVGRGAHRGPARAALIWPRRAFRSSRPSSRCWPSWPPSCPPGEGWLFEPKWDGFRAIVFRDGARLYLQSRDLRPLDRYFPELAPPSSRAFPRAPWWTGRS